tara:strand:- start:269 stop:472 length:204 start_codon:yes stop_codon:yes gene_type:complete
VSEIAQSVLVNLTQDTFGANYAGDGPFSCAVDLQHSSPTPKLKCIDYVLICFIDSPGFTGIKWQFER